MRRRNEADIMQRLVQTEKKTLKGNTSTNVLSMKCCSLTPKQYSRGSYMCKHWYTYFTVCFHV